MIFAIMSSTYKTHTSVPSKPSVMWTPINNIDPLHVRGNAANPEGRTIRFFYMRIDLVLSCFVLQIGCIPMMYKGSAHSSKTSYIKNAKGGTKFEKCLKTP